MSGGLHVAYQVVGSGPPDLVLIPEWSGNVELRWDEPRLARFLSQMASFSRLLVFDKRGVGLSDPVALSELPSLEEWADDVLAVMESAGSERAAIVAVGQGGPMAMVFAATHPDRVASLVLVNTLARMRRAPDYPAGIPPEIEARARTARSDENVAPEAFFGQEMAADARFLTWWRRYARMSASPGTWIAMQRMLVGTDVREVLSVIRVPTLVIHRRGDQWVRVDHGRFLAQHIPDARYVELDGTQHQFFLGDTERLLEEIQRFVGGQQHTQDVDRVLATVLFTDLVASTEQASQLGDRRWVDVLDAHDEAVRTELDRFRGIEVKMTGDGALAIFDGPGRAIRCACAIRDSLQALGLRVRAGLHTCEIERRGRDVGGLGVHIAQRISGFAQPGEVLVSSTVKDLVAGSDLMFDDRGTHTLKGVPEPRHIFAART